MQLDLQVSPTGQRLEKASCALLPSTTQAESAGAARPWCPAKRPQAILAQHSAFDLTHGARRCGCCCLVSLPNTFSETYVTIRFNCLCARCAAATVGGCHRTHRRQWSLSTHTSERGSRNRYCTTGGTQRFHQCVPWGSLSNLCVLALACRVILPACFSAMSCAHEHKSPSLHGTLYYICQSFFILFPCGVRLAAVLFTYDA